MALDIVLVVLGSICMIAGILGCILPALPGLPLCYLGIIFLQFTSKVDFSVYFLAVSAIIIIVVQILDYYVPIWGTKKFGGGKKGAVGSAVGIFAGIFIIPPWGMIICPFVGAVIGELIDNKEISVALKAGFGSFLGFLAGTLVKLLIALVLTVYFIAQVITSYISGFTA